MFDSPDESLFCCGGRRSMVDQWSVPVHEFFLCRHICRLGLYRLYTWLGGSNHIVDHGDIGVYDGNCAMGARRQPYAILC